MVSGGKGGSQQEPPPQLVKSKEPLPVVPVDDPKQRAPQQSKARLAMRERIVNAQPHDPNIARARAKVVGFPQIHS